jgi:MscS family membrane protein
MGFVNWIGLIWRSIMASSNCIHKKTLHASDHKTKAHVLISRPHRMIRRNISLPSMVIFASLMFLLSACMSVSQPPESQATTTRDRQPTITPSPVEKPTIEPTSILPAELLATRIPDPTATPGAINRSVTNFTDSIGMTNVRILGLFTEDWINLVISGFFIIFSYFLAFWASRFIITYITKRITSKLNEELVKIIGANLRWMIMLPVASFSINRLQFVSVGLKTFFGDIFFVLAIYFISRILLNIIELSTEWIQLNWFQEDQYSQFDSILVIINRFSKIIIIIIGITILMSNFGINVAVLTTTLGIGGFAISLAAKDTIADAIAGVIILVDQPFRIGDRIQIEFLGTWGDVEDIGLRTTRIRTRDNRMVIIPNSVISNNQIVNYTYPDPRYRVQTHVDITHGSDVETVRQLLHQTLSQVDGILHDKPIDVLYFDMIGPAMRFRLRWWIQSYMDTRQIFDKVHTAVQNALNQAGIESPYLADNVNILLEDDATHRLSQVFNPERKSN